MLVSLALVGVRWPYVGSGLHLALALWLGFFFLHVRGAGSILLIYGPLLLLTYPGTGFTPFTRYNNFRRVLTNNPCKP